MQLTSSLHYDFVIIISISFRIVTQQKSAKSSLRLNMISNLKNQLHFIYYIYN